jgi:3-oxoacyl-[acyl-carrier protein] reductase
LSTESEPLAGQLAVVTGASRGIGQAIAGRLARDGAEVVATATGEKGLEAIATWSAAAGVATRVRGLPLDVTDPASQAAFLAAVEPLGTPDILVNNAGVTRDGLLMRMSDEDWQVVIDTNLNAVFRLTRAFVRGMIRRRSGRIVNITSVVGQTGNPGQTNYVAAKAGLIGFTRALAQELGTRGITVNAVAPGFIITDMTAGLDDNTRQTLLARIALGRLGAPEDVAAAVAFLASAGAGYITGHTLAVNGGMAMN